MDILRIVLAIILPPLGVFLQVGLTKHFWINVLPVSFPSQKQRLRLRTEAGNLRIELSAEDGAERLELAKT